MKLKVNILISDWQINRLKNQGNHRTWKKINLTNSPQPRSPLIWNIRKKPTY
ncbi:MAG: hypothetical protein MRERV_32c038 [Mycoplasmataceae bacterium RV_VA103A]|nr:MAG: hypothetical protein MRERV_32c038 [Mycoplasmataceae bacterium RV_VA103A]